MILALAVGVGVVAVAGAASGPAAADPQASFSVACDRPNTGITAGWFANLNDEIPDPLTSTSLMQVVDTDPVIPGQATTVELKLPFPDLAGGFPPNDLGITYGTFYIKSVTVTVPIPSGYDVTTVNPTESPDKNYVTVSRSGTNIVAVVQSPVAGSRIRINTEVANPVAEVETSSGVWVPVVMPGIVMSPRVTAAAGSTITWRPPSSSNLVVKWNRDFGWLIGSINWNDLAMPCTPANPNQAIATTTVASPGLSVTKSADESSVVAGAGIHFHVTVRNTGNVALTGVVVTDANAPGCAGSVGNLAVGAQVTRHCTVTTTAGNIPSFSNTAGADSNETAAVTSNTVNVGVVSVASTGISGTVTDRVAGQPIAGAWLAILRSSDYRVVGGSIADGSGNYDVSLPVGSYYLYAIDPTGRHNAGFHGSPTVVNVTAGTKTDADPTMAPNRGGIGGIVTEEGTGTPIAGAFVLALNGSSGTPESGAVANGSGQFTIPDLAAANHLVVYVDPSGDHAARYYVNAEQGQGSTPVSVGGGATSTANGTMPLQTPAGGGSSLTGVVSESGTNAPLSGIRVVALRESDFRFASSTITDGSGAYRLDVAAGSYKLFFVDPAGLHHAEWHENQPYTGLASATSATAPGTVSAALDPNIGTMSGTITDDPSGAPLAGAWVIALDSAGAIVGGAVTDASGNYAITGLPAGTYRATIADPSGGRTQEYWNNSLTYAGGTPFVIAGGSTTDIDGALALP